MPSTTARPETLSMDDTMVLIPKTKASKISIGEIKCCAPPNPR